MNTSSLLTTKPLALPAVCLSYYSILAFSIGSFGAFVCLAPDNSKALNIKGCLYKNTLNVNRVSEDEVALYGLAFMSKYGRH